MRLRARLVPVSTVRFETWKRAERSDPVGRSRLSLDTVLGPRILPMSETMPWSSGRMGRLPAVAGWCLVMGGLGCASSPDDAPSSDETSSALSATVDPRPWGMKTVDRIRFVALTVRESPGGARLSVQRLASQVPRAPVASRDFTAPVWQGDGSLIAPLRRRNDHALGGAFSAFARAPSTARAALVPGQGLRLDFERRSEGWSGLWIQLFDHRVHPADRRYLDVRSASHLVFWVRRPESGAVVGLRVADRGLERREEAVSVGSLASFTVGPEDDRGWRPVRVPVSAIPEAVDRRRLASIALLVASPGKGQVLVRDVGLVRNGGRLNRSERPGLPRGRSATTSRAAERAATDRALWVWVASEVASDPEQSRELLELARRWDLTRVYLQVPRSGMHGTTADALTELSPLVRRLGAEGIRADALDGHPAFVLRRHHDAVADTVRAVVEYNRRAKPTERFVGVRFDNEPYLLDGFFGPRREDLLKAYVELLEHVGPMARAGGLRLGVDIPFWFDSRDRRHDPTAELDGRPFSEALIDRADEVTLMDYRTFVDGPDGVLAHASAELSYARRVGKRVAVGLETVHLPDERVFEFGPNGPGARLAVAPTESGRARLVFFGHGSGEELGRFVLANPGAKLLGAMHEARAPAAKLSFFGRTPAVLRRAMAHIARELEPDPAFGGLAIHSWRGLRKLERTSADSR